MDREAGRGDQNGSAEVRLLHDQRHRDSDDQERDREVLGRGLILAAVEVPGKHHRERDLHQFRRLDLGDADIEPAGRAFDRGADHQRREKQEDTERVKRHRELHQVPRVYVREKNQHEESDQDVPGLVRDSPRVAVARGEQRHEARERQNGDDDRESEIHP